MPILRIDLQEGFRGDKVVVRVNGKEVLQRAVKTRVQTGLAAIEQLDVAPGDITVEVELPERRISGTFHLQGGRDTYVGVSVSANGKLTHKTSLEPFGYL